MKGAVVKVPGQTKPLRDDLKLLQAPGQVQCLQASGNVVRHDCTEVQVVRGHCRLVQEEQARLHCLAGHSDCEDRPDRESRSQLGAEWLAFPVTEAARKYDEARPGRSVQKVGI